MNKKLLFIVFMLFEHSCFSSMIEEKETLALTDRVWLHPQYAALQQSFQPLCEHIKSTLKDGDDVHKLDDFVFGVGKKIRILSQIGQQLEIGKSILPLSAVREGLLAFVGHHPDFVLKHPMLVGFYGESQLSQESLKGFIQGFFGTLSTSTVGVAGLKDELGDIQKITSLAYTTALEAFESMDPSGLWDSTYPMYRLINGIIEDRTTGGCPQGCVNRLCFRDYIAILQHIGLGQLE